MKTANKEQVERQNEKQREYRNNWDGKFCQACRRKPRWHGKQKCLACLRKHRQLCVESRKRAIAKEQKSHKEHAQWLAAIDEKIRRGMAKELEGMVK